MKRLAFFLGICLLLTACNLPSASDPTQPLAPSATSQADEVGVGNAPTPQPAHSDTPEPTRAPLPTQAPVVIGNHALIIDHTTTDISRIPPEWLEKAKQLTVALAHTSHGSQIITGLLWLQDQDPRYAAAVRTTWEGFGLPDAQNALRLYDGNNVPDDDYITPELYWSTDDGLNYTRSVAASGLFNVSMWTWCGQQSENDAATVQQYLHTMDDLQAQFPEVKFVYLTGHTDGNWDGSRLLENNRLVRDYALENGKILFDFADIESYDPDGNYYPNTDDSCPWCQPWCDAHPGQCANLDQIEDCAHTHPLQCKLKAQAFWWMMARLAGWDGQ